jgi:hypothetical protein
MFNEFHAQFARTRADTAQARHPAHVRQVRLVRASLLRLPEVRRANRGRTW